MKEALLYEKLDGERVHCTLCRFDCIIAPGKRGVCGVRENRSGTLYSLVYDRIISTAVDPIEKKPLFNFLPGSKSFSLATMGCNFRCLHCQNYEISQTPREEKTILGEAITPERLVDMAMRNNCKSIAYTYTEPTIFFELAYETAKLAEERSIKNIFVSNGYMTRQMLDGMKGLLHGINVDLKGFTEEHYRKICGAKLEGVLDSLRYIKELGIWLEVTTLAIPGYNDDDETFEGIAAFIRDDLGIETPWHVTAFYPTFKLLNAPRTPASTLRRAREIGLKAGLRYVYEGNLPGKGGENTFCWSCGELLIERVGYRILKNAVKNSACPACGSIIDGFSLD